MTRDVVYRGYIIRQDVLTGRTWMRIADTNVCVTDGAAARHVIDAIVAKETL